MHREFVANLQFCSLPKKEIKAAVLNGKTVKEKERTENELRAKKIGVWVEKDDNLDDAS